MPKLRSLIPRLRLVDTSTVPLPPKVKAPIYNIPAFQAWRAEVVVRAGGRCEAVDQGHRCTKAMPEHRMFADHVVELKDGGQPFDVTNGQCLCGAHHTNKTMIARLRRHHARVDGG